MRRHDWPTMRKNPLPSVRTIARQTSDAWGVPQRGSTFDCFYLPIASADRSSNRHFQE